MTTQISGDTGVSQVQAGAVGYGDYAAGSIKASDLSGGTGTGSITQVSSQTTPLPVGFTVINKPHSLGVVPHEVALELVCLTTEHGWGVGTVLQCIYLYNGVSGHVPLQIAMDPANVYAVIPAGYALGILSASTGNGVTPTAANWAYRFKWSAA